MKLEEGLGFRSSFNFIPAGSYPPPLALMERLRESGFEVGVHDYHHDGRLYSSRRHFLRCAQGINSALASWKAVGYRSGFMLRNLDWIHDLNILYDASTFDTDPFEPQPDGANIIFPFWIPRPASPRSTTAELSDPRARSGYWELPYTLAQDSTLFLLLQEKDPSLWLRKLDWIVENGGMALLNVHPDYLAFDGEKDLRWRFPVAHYEALLKYVRDRYFGDYYHTTPAQLVGELTANHTKTLPQRPKRIAMVSYSVYESDNRVMRYAEALAQRGDDVQVLALRLSPNLPVQETIQGVRVHRIQDRFKRDERSKLSYLLPILRFLWQTGRWLRRNHAQEPFHLLHIHNIPDFLVFAGWFPRRRGAKVILDIHDIVPEFFSSKFSVPDKSWLVWMLKAMERISARRADHVIISNHLWLRRYARRSRNDGQCSVFINHVNSSIFHERDHATKSPFPVMIFPGGLQWHQGLDIAVRAFKKVVKEIPTAQFHIYGEGSAKKDLIELIRELGLNSSVRFFEPVSIRKVAQLMASATLGVVPKRADSFGDEAYSTKIMEFMSVGVPVVASSTSIDRYYFDDSLVRFFPSGDDAALAEAILEVLRDEKKRTEMVANALAYAKRHNWDSRQRDYFELVDNLCAGLPTAVTSVSDFERGKSGGEVGAKS